MLTPIRSCSNLTKLSCIQAHRVFCLCFAWCPCMAISVVSVQYYNSGLLASNTLLTRCHYHQGARLNVMKTFFLCSLLCVHLLFLFSFFNLTYSRWTSSLPSCLWTLRIFSSLPGSRLMIFLSRCKFSTLTTRQPMMVEFYLLTFPRFPLRKKEHKSYLGKTSALASVQFTY